MPEEDKNFGGSLVMMSRENYVLDIIHNSDLL